MPQIARERAALESGIAENEAKGSPSVSAPADQNVSTPAPPTAPEPPPSVPAAAPQEQRGEAEAALRRVAELEDLDAFEAVE